MGAGYDVWVFKDDWVCFRDDKDKWIVYKLLS